MGGWNQWYRTTHTSRGRPFHRRRDIETLGEPGVNIQYHNLPDRDPNRNFFSPDRISTYRVGNADVNNQGKGSTTKENNDKVNRETTQHYHEKIARALETSTTNTYAQQHIKVWLRGNILPQQK